MIGAAFPTTARHMAMLVTLNHWGLMPEKEIHVQDSSCHLSYLILTNQPNLTRSVGFTHAQTVLTSY